MDKYAMFTYDFLPNPQTSMVFEGDEPVPDRLTDDYCREHFNMLFGDEGTTFNVRKKNSSDADNYPCTVLGHYGRIVLLRLINPKYVPLYKQLSSSTNGVPDIKKTKEATFPFINIVIDCREDRNAIAMSINNDAWRDIDKVAAFFQESINSMLEMLSQGFKVRLIPQKIHRDFIEYSRELIKKRNLLVTKMTFFFSGGTINPELEAIIKQDGYLRTLLEKYTARHCEVSYSNPEVRNLLDGRSRTLEHIVELVCSDPLSEAFRLRITYDDGTTLICGKASRLSYDMDYMAFESMRGFGSLFPEQEMGGWFDSVKKKMEEERDASDVRQIGETEAA